jgi:phosphoglucomutase
MAGIVLTASHNPPEYNGQCTGNGGQLVPPQDKQLLDTIEKIQTLQVHHQRFK